jgi:hypothetical protein
MLEELDFNNLPDERSRDFVVHLLKIVAADLRVA